jgi:alpha-1,2-mannosyltransferase
VVVNSSWTQGHIKVLWGNSPEVQVVYPPCDTAALRAAPLGRHPIQGGSGSADGGGSGNSGSGSSGRKGKGKGKEPMESLDEKIGAPYVLSVGQFRPEKDHPLQLHAWALMRGTASSGGAGSSKRAAMVLSARLKIVGGCRGRGLTDSECPPPPPYTHSPQRSHIPRIRSSACSE